MPANDERRKILENDYGLKVLDSCPTARTSLVVVAFSDTDQVNRDFVYCANPNRLVKAGEYVYNTATGNLETAARRTEQCTVSLGGVCIVK